MNDDPRLGGYLRFREKRIELNGKLTRQLSKKIVRKGARKLGLLTDGTLVLESEDETCVLMDYCIHDCREMGKNAVDRRLARPSLGEEERQLLEGMKAARFSLFRVTKPVPGVGVNVLDILLGESLLIVDINFGMSTEKGLVLASRIVPFGDCFTTTGAALPVDEEVLPFLRTLAVESGIGDVSSYAPRPSLRERSDFTAMVLKTCLAAGASHRVRYEPVMG